MKLLHHLADFARAQPESPAISAGALGSQTLTYAELHARAQALAAQLRQGAAPVELALVIANRGLDLVCAILAGLLAEVPLAIVDPRQGSHRIAQLVAAAPSALLLVDRLGESIVGKFAHGEARHCALLQLERLASAPLPRAVAPASEASPATTAVVLFTSGSTGSAKGVRISRADLDRRLATEIDWFDLGAGEAVLGVLPLSFDVGLTQLLASLYCGAHHVLLNSWLAKDIVKHIGHFSARGLALSPVVWKGLLAAPAEGGVWAALNSLRYVTLSGGTLAAGELATIQAKLTSGNLIKTYGQTEMFRIGSLKLAEAPAKLHSVGRAYPGVELQVRNDAGQLCAANEEGEIWASGLGAMLGYLDASPDHAGKIVDGQVRTGDYGYLDDGGFLYIRGRRDEMIKILDQRVFPDDVAASIQSLLQIDQVVVVAKKTGDEALLAAFFKRAELSLDDAALRRLLQQNLASHLVPKHLVRVDEFPATASGKIDKPGLLNALIKEVTVDGI